MGSLTSSTLRQSTHRRFTVATSEDVGAVRRAVGGYAERLRPGAHLAAVVAQTATELASNLLRHATGGGWILARPLPPAAVEIIAVDRGSGIRDVDTAVAGRTRAPSGLGCGLAAVRRAAARFDVHSDPGRGTVVLAVVDDRVPAAPAEPRLWAGVSIGIDEPCGDGWAVVEGAAASTVAVIDGLGHGPQASIATDAAVAALELESDDLRRYLEQANVAMRHTRGAAVTVCRLEPHRGELQCLSVGNVSASLVHSGGQSGLVAFNGTMGLREAPPKAKIMAYPWLPGAVLAVWTDGLTSRIDLTAEAELLTHDPAVVAAVLHREYARDQDDATVLVVRNGSRR